MFAQWALAHPRIMFASIDTTVANEGSSDLRQKLLGFRDSIYGLSFMSHVTPPLGYKEEERDLGRPPMVSNSLRHFNANNVDTAGIQASLLTRFRTDLQLGLLPSVEEGAMSSEATVSPGMYPSAVSKYAVLLCCYAVLLCSAMLYYAIL